MTSHLSILATAAEGQGGTEDTSHSTLSIREEILAAADIPPQMSSLLPVTDIAIGDPSKRSLGTEHIEPRAPDAIALRIQPRPFE